MRTDTLKAVANPRASRRAFFGVAALVFVASVALTVIGCMSMSSMSELPMQGGWSLSMTWAPMCGQKWPRVAATFVGMWIVMMVAMMLPSLAPVLWRYHEAIGKTGVMRARWMTALAGVGYFFVWAVLGVIVFVLGILTKRRHANPPPAGCDLKSISLLRHPCAATIPSSSARRATR
ncbi:DUF2182 domain-containing protein [Paraburkholderia hospita]|uniref:copper chaperone n=1 Tax=Paraburkholderia hospita TaxID=169430 RepID=UPI00297007BE